MSKAPKQSGTQTTTQKVEIPGWLDQRFQNTAQDAAGLYNQYSQNPRPYGPSGVPPTSVGTQSGLHSMMNVAGSGQSDNAFEQYNDTLAGNYLHGGEGFDAAYEAASNKIIPQVTSAFNARGRMGGTAGMSELTGRLGDSFAGLYNNERNRQMGALNMAPQMDTLGYEPARHQLQVGAIQDAKAQDRANEARAKFNYARDYQGSTLDDYIARLQGIAPTFQGGSTRTQPIMSQGSNLGTIGSLALGAAGLATGNPWLALAGSSAGGLLGGGHTGYTQTPGGYYQGFGY